MIDISGLSYFMPIIGFLFVFVIIYALLAKTKLLGENKYINLLISFIIAIIFATFASAQEYIETVTPWFVVFAVALFFILILVGLSQQKISDVVGKNFVWVLVIVLMVVFLIVAVQVFSSWQQISDFVANQAKVAGAVILLIIAALAAWAVTRK